MTTLKLLKIADENDCYITSDSDGNFALIQRHYDNEGLEQVRFRPDPVHFKSEAEWRNATEEQVQEWIC